MDKLHQKLDALKSELASYGGAAIAFSGGVDSTFLLRIAHEVLGERVLAVTASSCSFPKRELNEAQRFCQDNHIAHIVCTSEELNIPGFRSNPTNRCYLCKRELFQKIWEIAKQHDLPTVAEGSNTDDIGDYRPGLTAIKELEVKSPLRAVGLSKADIRQLSQELNLPTWAKPSFACLASRFPYGETITPEKLNAIEQAEQLLLDLGLHQVRVRIHGSLARIEIAPEEFPLLLEHRLEIYDSFKEYGFSYTALDLRGYRTGSMNETILPKSNS